MAGLSSALIGWVGLLQPSTDVRAGIDRILSTRTGFAFFTDVWGGLPVSDDALRANPTEWVRLLTGMLTQTKTLPRGLSRWLREAAATLERAGADKASMTALSKALYAFPE